MRIFSKYNLSISVPQLFLVVFVVFPVLLALVSQTALIVQTWDTFKILQIGFFVSVLILPIFSILKKSSLLKLDNNDLCVIVIWVIAIAVALRIILLPLIGTSFLSDMEDIHLLAVDISSGNPLKNIDNYPNIPNATYLNMSALVLSFVYKVVGPGTANAKLFMILLSGLTTLLIFIAGRELANVQVGLIASLLFATLPSLVCYTGVLSGDHLAIPLIVLAIIIQSRLGASNGNFSFSFIAGYLLLGMTIGFIDWFRPIGIILIIAHAISILFYKFGRKNFFRSILVLAILIFSYLTVSKISIIITENIFQTKVLSTPQRLGAYFFVGLNLESNGGVNLEDAKLINETYNRFGNDNFGANQYLIESAFARLGPGQLVQLFKQKFILMWSSHDALFDYSLAGSNDQELVNLLRNIETMLYIIITTFMLFHAFSLIRRKSDSAIFTMQLFIFGFAFLMLFFEVQNRYIISVIPYSILLGVLGMQNAFAPAVDGQ
jgi:4-amino-4-deoxy-L-arabinose transferase-like glycosyltransferase